MKDGMFEAEDFDSVCIPNTMGPEEAAAIANAKLPEIIQDWVRRHGLEMHRISSISWQQRHRIDGDDPMCGYLILPNTLAR